MGWAEMLAVRGDGRIAARLWHTFFFLAFVWWGSCWSWCAWDLPVMGAVSSGGMESEAVVLDEREARLSGDVVGRMSCCSRH